MLLIYKYILLILKQKHQTACTLKYRNLKAFLYVSVNYKSTFETHLNKFISTKHLCKRKKNILNYFKQLSKNHILLYKKRYFSLIKLYINLEYKPV